MRQSTQRDTELSLRRRMTSSRRLFLRRPKRSADIAELRILEVPKSLISQYFCIHSGERATYALRSSQAIRARE